MELEKIYPTTYTQAWGINRFAKNDIIGLPGGDELKIEEFAKTHEGARPIGDFYYMLHTPQMGVSEPDINRKLSEIDKAASSIFRSLETTGNN